MFTLSSLLGPGVFFSLPWGLLSVCPPSPYHQLGGILPQWLLNIQTNDITTEVVWVGACSFRTPSTIRIHTPELGSDYSTGPAWPLVGQFCVGCWRFGHLVITDRWCDFTLSLLGMCYKCMLQPWAHGSTIARCHILFRTVCKRYMVEGGKVACRHKIGSPDR